MTETNQRRVDAMKPEHVRFKRKSQVTVPHEIVEALDLHEGDDLQVRLENGKIVFVPMVSIPKDQAWFWSKEWQEEEREADEEIKAGRVKGFSNAEDLIKSLHEDAEEYNRNDK